MGEATLIENGVHGVELRYFCRWLARATEEYFKDPEVQRRFEIWKKEQEEKEKGEV